MKTLQSTFWTLILLFGSSDYFFWFSIFASCYRNSCLKRNLILRKMHIFVYFHSCIIVTLDILIVWFIFFVLYNYWSVFSNKYLADNWFRGYDCCCHLFLFSLFHGARWFSKWLVGYEYKEVFDLCISLNTVNDNH